jgi:hypothetical protein
MCATPVASARPGTSGAPVVIPPELVQILRWHMNEFGIVPDGRLFRQFRRSAEGVAEGVVSSLRTCEWACLKT